MATNKRHAINRNKNGASVSVTKKRRYAMSRSSNKNGSQIIDYVIVGAGITGAYLARRLSLQFPHKKILVLEREDHIGGRLESSTSAKLMDPKTKVVPEFGGMRLFPSIHPRAVRLLKLLKLATVEVPYVQANGFYYGRGHRFNNDALFPETELVYNVDDDDFNETQYDYKGNPKFSTMISKLCSYSHRSEFILRLLTAELELNPEQQIMILAHNKSLITYLHDAITHRKIADGSVGYYIGGMKEAALKLSESKKVIIATYAMASEGLDIKTLTSLILASPKTDVCQSVGRILRQKHSSPLVIDIIDAHDIFMSQWYKRRKYYKSQNYKVLVCDIDEYEGGHNKDLSKWKVSWEPKKAGGGGGGGKATKGVSKKIHPSKPKVAEKSIAERLNININIKPVEKTGYDDDDDDDNQSVDRDNNTEDEDEVTHERQRNESRGKAGLNGKGCLIDMSMFGQL